MKIDVPTDEMFDTYNKNGRRYGRKVIPRGDCSYILVVQSPEISIMADITNIIGRVTFVGHDTAEVVPFQKHPRHHGILDLLKANPELFCILPVGQGVTCPTDDGVEIKDYRFNHWSICLKNESSYNFN
jgi:hypothetical protein